MQEGGLGARLLHIDFMLCARRVFSEEALEEFLHQSPEQQLRVVCALNRLEWRPDAAPGDDPYFIRRGELITLHGILRRRDA